MRRIDWADKEAEEIFDLVRDRVDDEEVVKRIASELRNAFLKGVDQEQIHFSLELKRGSTTRYVITRERLRTPGMRRAISGEAYLNLDDAEDDKIMFTWDGKPSVKTKP